MEWSKEKMHDGLDCRSGGNPLFFWFFLMIRKKQGRIAMRMLVLIFLSAVWSLTACASSSGGSLAELLAKAT